MEIFPDGDRLVALAQLPPEAIDTVHVGRTARVRLIAYRRATAPVGDGEVIYLSADLMEDERDGTSGFEARVALDPASLAQHPEVALTAGMPVEVAIRIGERRAGDYILEPVLRHFRRALWEDEAARSRSTTSRPSRPSFIVRRRTTSSGSKPRSPSARPASPGPATSVPRPSPRCAARSTGGRTMPRLIARWGTTCCARIVCPRRPSRRARPSSTVLSLPSIGTSSAWFCPRPAILSKPSRPRSARLSSTRRWRARRERDQMCARLDAAAPFARRA